MIAVERDRLGLANPRFEPQSRNTPAQRDRLERCQQSSANASATRLGGDPHAFQFRRSVAFDDQRPAPHGCTATPRYQEADVWRRQRLEIDEMVACRRIKAFSVGI